MLVVKSTTKWDKEIKDKELRIKLLEDKLKQVIEKYRALFKRTKELQSIEEIHKKTNGILQSRLNDAQQKLKDIEKDRLNAGRTAGIDV